MFLSSDELVMVITDTSNGTSLVLLIFNTDIPSIETISLLGKGCCDIKSFQS